VLYALAEFAVPLLGTHPGDFEGPTPLKSFAEHFGGRITRAELEAFLDQSPRSLDLAVWLMPARTKDWSVVDVILPRLDAYLALPHDGGSTPGPGLGSLVGALCYTDFDARGWAKLRAYFDRRAASHPGDPLNVIMDLGHYAPARCHAHG
jgi:hypothetical protein